MHLSLQADAKQYIVRLLAGAGRRSEVKCPGLWPGFQRYMYKVYIHTSAAGQRSRARVTMMGLEGKGLTMEGMHGNRNATAGPALVGSTASLGPMICWACNAWCISCLPHPVPFQPHQPALWAIDLQKVLGYLPLALAFRRSARASACARGLLYPLLVLVPGVGSGRARLGWAASNSPSFLNVPAAPRDIHCSIIVFFCPTWPVRWVHERLLDWRVAARCMRDFLFETDYTHEIIKKNSAGLLFSMVACGSNTQNCNKGSRGLPWRHPVG